MIKGIKICGVSDFETLKFIVNHPYPPNYIGFITNYEKSKRFVDYEKLKELLKIKRQNINFVSVMVKPSNEFLKKIENLNFDYYQLYDVSPERIKTIRNMKPIQIISALTINEKKDVEKHKLFSGITDIYLFDSKGYEKSASFDHNLIKDIKLNKELMLAGNIQFDDSLEKYNNIEDFIDLSGGLENSGLKDKTKIEIFLNNLNKIKNET